MALDFIQIFLNLKYVPLELFHLCDGIADVLEDLGRHLEFDLVADKVPLHHFDFVSQFLLLCKRQSPRFISSSKNFQLISSA